MSLDLEIRHPDLAQIVRPEAELEVVVSGFQFLEGPVWHPTGRYLDFNDIPGNTAYRWRPDEGVTVVRTPSNKANGNTLDRQGRLLTCEHATSRVVRTEADGALTVLAAHYRGQELNSPNDIVVRRDDTIYFTDPNFGRRPTRMGIERPQQLAFQAVFRLDPVTGELMPVTTECEQPNGLCFSLDEQLMYVADSPRGHIRRFAVLPDGTLAAGEVWAEVRAEGPGVPDGIKVDAAGRVYCAGAGGIHVFAPDATCLGVIHTPAQAANFCWGDDDLCSLYIAASTTLYRLRVLARGVGVL